MNFEVRILNSNPRYSAFWFCDFGWLHVFFLWNCFLISEMCIIPWQRLLWGLKMMMRIKSLAWCPAHHHENGSFCHICEVVAIYKIAHRLKPIPFAFVEKNREFFFLCYGNQVFFFKKDLWTDIWQKQCSLLGPFFLVTLPPHAVSFSLFPFFFLITLN